MATTILLAKLLGLYFIISGIFVITQQKTLGLVLKDMFSHRAITFLVGALLVLGGGALALHTNPSESGLALFITVISWAIVLKGIFYIFAPDTMYAMVKRISRSSFSALGGLVTLIGLYLLFFIR